jgi:predicted DNA-binding transcriptional regulator AlpA
MRPQFTPITERLVDIKTVCAVLSRSRASIYRDIERGDFPEPIKLGHSSRWRMSDLNRIVDPDSPKAA